MRKVFVLIILLFSIIITSAGPYSSSISQGPYSSNINKVETLFNNNTAFVNESAHWVTPSLGVLSDVNATQHTNNGGVLNIKESWLTSFGNDLWCSLFGCTIDGNVTADYFIGNGSLLTGITHGIWESVSETSQLINAEDIYMQDKNLLNVTNITLVNSIKDSNSRSRAYFDSEGAWVIEA